MKGDLKDLRDSGKASNLTEDNRMIDENNYETMGRKTESNGELYKL